VLLFDFDGVLEQGILVWSVWRSRSCNTLSWNSHINNIAKSCHLRICSLYKIQCFIPYKYKLILGHALVLSLVSYMSTLWSSTTNNNLLVMEKIIRCLARFISGKRKYDSVAPVICNDLKWLFPKELSQYNMMCIMFKL